MLSVFGQVSNEKVITTSSNLKNIKKVTGLVMAEIDMKSSTVNGMSNDEYTDYLYLRLLAREAKKKAKMLEIKRSHF